MLVVSLCGKSRHPHFSYLPQPTRLNLRIIATPSSPEESSGPREFAEKATAFLRLGAGSVDR
jgi:hypothetical protein